MPLYDFKCPKCRRRRTVNHTMDRPLLAPSCGCGQIMQRDYSTIQVRGQYKKPIMMDSCAIRPEEVPIHRKMFPDVEITDRGTPIIRSLKQKRSYLKRIGWVDKNSYV